MNVSIVKVLESNGGVKGWFSWTFPGRQEKPEELRMMWGKVHLNVFKLKLRIFRSFCFLPSWCTDSPKPQSILWLFTISLGWNLVTGITPFVHESLLVCAMDRGLVLLQRDTFSIELLCAGPQSIKLTSLLNIGCAHKYIFLIIIIHIFTVASEWQKRSFTCFTSYVKTSDTFTCTHSTTPTNNVANSSQSVFGYQLSQLLCLFCAWLTGRVSKLPACLTACASCPIILSYYRIIRR